ncbi:histidine phosphatase family protein [Candidatus Omnitrophota bacterium]
MKKRIFSLYIIVLLVSPYLSRADASIDRASTLSPYQKNIPSQSELLQSVSHAVSMQARGDYLLSDTERLRIGVILHMVSLFEGFVSARKALPDKCIAINEDYWKRNVCMPYDVPFSKKIIIEALMELFNCTIFTTKEDKDRFKEILQDYSDYFTDQDLKPMRRLPRALKKLYRIIDPVKGTINGNKDMIRELKGSFIEKNITLIAIRHGETYDNQDDGLAGGGTNSSLTPLGHEQAEQCAKDLYKMVGGDEWLAKIILGEEPFPEIYSSPKNRAEKTALPFVRLLNERVREVALEQIADGYKVADKWLNPKRNIFSVKTDNRLTEIRHGFFEGWIASIFRTLYQKYGEQFYYDLIRKPRKQIDKHRRGQSRLEHIMQVRSFIQDKNSRKNKNKIIFVFAHRGTILDMRYGLGDFIADPLLGNALHETHLMHVPNATPYILVSNRQRLKNPSKYSDYAREEEKIIRAA